MFERILLVLDGSGLADQATPYAGLLAGVLKARLQLICVKKGPVSQHEDYLANKVRELSGAFGLANLKAGEVIAGEASDGIINYAEQNKADLVIMATHSRSGILLWPMGSMATRVLETISMPLLAIKSSGQPITPQCILCHRILVPLDGSKPGEAALPYAVDLCRRLETPLTLLRIVEPGMATHTVGGLQYVNLLPEQIERLTIEAREYLGRVSESIHGIKQIDTEVRQAMPVRDIMSYSEKIGADLIALSTHGASNARGAFGSVFRKVLQSGGTHILAVRPQS